ncbi:glycosyltransferase [Helicobacter canis]|uniref:Glycosyltransferase n=2 Tax=Helicobacter canis TaxID=29419 RepID=A0A5M9QJ59_9HELI|nr:glycosyltransferase [Helicobacter canis]KAA8707642.1 glycosyltransferase [Helicobacter canis]
MLSKLLHLASDTFKGGAESVFRNTIEATLESKQFDIYVASCDELPPCGIDNAHFLRLDDWQLYPKWRGAYKYIFNLTNYKRLKAFLFTIKPDIIHTQNYLSRLSPSVLFALRAYKAKHPKVKLIYTQHGFGPCANGGLYNYAKGQICEQCIGHSKGLRIAYQNCDRRGRIHSILKALRSPFYQGALLQEKELFDTIICVGEFQRSKHIQDGWDSSKLITLTNPIETHFYNPHISLQDKQDLLVFFGRLSPEKNVPLLLHAFANLLKLPRFSHYKLLIIGDGDDKPKCLELANRLLQHLELESTFAKVDSVSGIHSDDLAKFRATADRKSSSTLNFAKSPTSNTTIPRILEEEKQAQSKNTSAPSSRDLQQQVVAIHNLQNAKVDSMDCHADFQSARNDSKLDSTTSATILNKSAKDSRSFNKNAKNVFCSQVDRRQDFCDKNGALQGESKVRTWACVTADSPQQNKGYRSALADVSLESPFLAQKPTPKPRKAQSSSQSPSDSKILELESGLFKARKEDKTRGLSTQRADEIHDSSPKAESLLSPRSPLPCTFLPPRTPKELAAILAKAKLSILPSLWYETFGLTIVESILAGTIPIASDLGAMQETIASFYGKSFSFDPRQALQDSNVQSLEVCIINTLDSYESEFATLLQKREEIMQNLHSNHYLKKLINLYLYGGGA